MPKAQLIEEELTKSVIGAFYEVYNTLGYGFLEHVYVRALEYELLLRGHRVGREVSVPIWYKGVEIARQRLDTIVDQKLVVESKSTYTLPTDARRQLYNYLRATKLEVGELLHFGPQAKFFRVYCQRIDRSIRRIRMSPPRRRPTRRR